MDVKIWATLARSLSFPLKEGLSVVAEGALSIYEPQGRYSLIVQRIEPDGVGARALALEALKQKLLGEHLIGPSRKRRALPFLPKRIGVVTSVSSAALRDFLQILHRRNPGVEVLVVDARVQGEGAATEIVRGLKWMSGQRVDLVVLTRGGGSVDDLWVFNEEAVIRAIAKCSHPVVSAIGHEIDVTLSDLVADLRAPTPSAAAELCTPVRVELQAQLASKRMQLARLLQHRIEKSRNRLQGQWRKAKDPRLSLVSHRLALSEVDERLTSALRNALNARRKRLAQSQVRLELSHPRKALGEQRRRFALAEQQLSVLLRRSVDARKASLQKSAAALRVASPRTRVAVAVTSLRQLSSLTARLGAALVRNHRAALVHRAQQLDALSPLKVLHRGYSIVTAAENEALVDSPQTALAHRELFIRFAAAPRIRVKTLGPETPFDQEESS